MKNPMCIKIAALLLALCFVEPRVAYADAKEDAAQAAKDIDAAYKEAQENIPNGTVKPNEDKLDEAARKNDDMPDKDPNKPNTEKAEKDARDHADEMNKPFKEADPPDRRGEKYREALRKRREACKRLKKALADLRKQRGEARKNPIGPSEQLEKAIRDAEKAEKDQVKIPERPALSMAVPQRAPTVATFVASGKIKIDTVGTGETIGHVADLEIQNLTDQPIKCAVGPVVLESGSGKNQHYACPSGQTVALNPHQTKTVPMNGVCLNRNKPPVGKGVSGDLVMNEANPSAPQNPNSHLPPADAGKLLRSCVAKYTAANQLQKSGALKNLPYHDPQKQKDIVVQWSTWMDPQICQIVGTTPATKEDLKKVVYKQVEEKGPMSPETKKKVDQGIDTIFAKVELTTAKAKDLEKPEKGTPPVAGTTVAGTPSAGQPVSAPTAAPGETVARTPTAAPQGPGTTATQPTATPTPCKDDPLALERAKDLVDKAVKACGDLDRLDREAGEAEDAADADDATPAGKEAKAKADKAAADAKAAKTAADTAKEDAKAAKDKFDKATKKDKPAARDDARTKAKAAEDAAKAAEAADKAAEAAKSPLRKKADAARKKVTDAVGAKWDARKEAGDAIGKLKCPENIDKLTKRLEEACGK
jgi:hypothetical protein